MKGKRHTARHEPSPADNRRTDLFAFVYGYRSHEEILEEAVEGLKADLSALRKDLKMTLDA